MHSPAGRDPFPLFLVFVGLFLTLGSAVGGGIFSPDGLLVEPLDVSFDRCLDVCAGDLWSWSSTSCACGCR